MNNNLEEVKYGKNYIFNISILTHDLIKKKNDEKEFIRYAKMQLLEKFVWDEDFENYLYSTSYTIKFKKIPYTTRELREAEDQLMQVYFDPQKTPIELEAIAVKKVVGLKPYHLMLTVERVDNE